MYALRYDDKHVSFMEKEALVCPRFNTETKWEDIPRGMVPIRLSETGFGKEFDIIHSKDEFKRWMNYPILMENLLFVRVETLIDFYNSDKSPSGDFVCVLRKNFS